MSRSVVIIAGEPSGDFLGAQLAKALKETEPDIRLSGLGGPQMEAQGIVSLFPYHDLAVMGIAEVLPNLFRILKRIRQTIDFIKETKPDIVVTIDSPDFCFRVAKAVKKEMADAPKMIHYVAPSVWAWREGRAEKVSRFLDGLICLFDFEPQYFEPYGLKAVAVGHPLVEGEAMTTDGAEYRDENGITVNETTIGVLFGSRRGEVRRVGRALRDAAFQIAREAGGNVHLIAPTLPHIKSEVFALLKDFPGQIHITTEPKDKWGAFASMDVAIAASGTVGLELAAMKVPHVIAYRLNWITWVLASLLVKVKFAHLANIMAGEMIVPEYLQGDCRADRIARGAQALLSHPAEQKQAFDSVRYRIGADQAQMPSQKAAEFVLSY